MVKFSIILPTYNEKDNIIAIITKVSQILGKYKDKYEIIIVDDNSPDKTAQIAKKRFKNLPNINVYVRKSERGLAKALLFGIKKAKGEHLIFMDSDFNHDPQVIPQLISLIDFYNVVVGSRYVLGGGMDDKIREKLSYIFNFFLRIVLRTKIHDNLSGYFAIRKSDVEKLPESKIFKGYGDYFIRLLFFSQKKNYKIIEVPVWYNIRKIGVSKSSFGKMIFQYTATALNLFYYDLFSSPKVTAESKTRELTK